MNSVIGNFFKNIKIEWVTLFISFLALSVSIYALTIQYSIFRTDYRSSIIVRSKNWPLKKIPKEDSPLEVNFIIENTSNVNIGVYLTTQAYGVCLKQDKKDRLNCGPIVTNVFHLGKIGSKNNIADIKIYASTLDKHIIEKFYKEDPKFDDYYVEFNILSYPENNILYHSKCRYFCPFMAIPDGELHHLFLFENGPNDVLANHKEYCECQQITEY